MLGQISEFVLVYSLKIYTSQIFTALREEKQKKKACDLELVVRYAEPRVHLFGNGSWWFSLLVSHCEVTSRLEGAS